MIDLATRWIEIAPLNEITSEKICNALLSIFTKFGFPSIILSDNGTQFLSHLTQAFTKMLQITQVFSARYHPQSNGCVERANQSIKIMIDKVCIDKPKEWDLFLPMILFAYRTSIHEATGYSPFQLLFGRQPKTPFGNFKENILNKQETLLSPFEFVQNVSEQIDYTNNIVKKTLEIASAKNAESVNKNRHLRTLESDDLVLILLPTGTGHNKEWYGPYKVIKRLNEVSYTILVDGSQRKYHINTLRKYNQLKADNEILSSLVAENSISEEAPIINAETYSINYCTTIKSCNINLQHITSQTNKENITRIINKFSSVISHEPGHTNSIEHSIELNDHTAFRSQTYIVPQMLKNKVDAQLDSLIEKKLIQKSKSQYSSPMVLVKKKNGDIRICCDYRKLNKVTNLDQEGLPNVEDIVNTVGKGKIFSSIDLTRGFWQIPMAKESIHYTAFTTHKGLFEWTVMPFGLVNSTATFTKMMRKILAPHPHIIHYVDDICIFTDNWEQHFEALEFLLQVLKEQNLTVSPDKIKIGVSEIEFLGHKFTSQGITPTSNFQEKILHIKTPTTKKHIRALLGLFNYYSKFIKNYAQIVRPLIELTKKFQPQKIKWNESCAKSLNTLKEMFNSQPILTTIQETDEVILSTDASKIGLGACLMTQTVINGKQILQPAQYLSRALSESEKKYSVIELECLAIFWAVRKLQRYLLGRHFTILVDHKPLMNFNISNINNNRINKYAMYLTDYQFDIKTIRGKDNHIPDVLSRLSVNIPDSE